jgi:beta-lactamase class C
MLKLTKILIIAAVIAMFGWVAFTSDSVVQKLSAAIGDGLPDTAWEWRGRVDYRKLDRQLTQLSKRPEMAGMAVAIVEDGQLRFVKTYGYADRSTDAPVTPETVFRWASVSKTATGMLAATLADQGKLDLGRPIASWKNSLRLPGGAEARLSLAQLLSHQTGVTKNAYDEKLEDGQSPETLRASLANAPLQCFPGTCHTYQNIAFDASSEILALAANKPFEEAVDERLFRPLGMASARFGMTGLTSAKDWARPYADGEEQRLKEAYWRVPTAAGVESNIVDFAIWMQASMGERKDVLPLSAIELAQKPRVATVSLYAGSLKQAISEAGYGLGWRSFTYAGQRYLGHSGAVSGYRATMIFEPKTRTGVVAMWNSNWGIPFRIPFAVFDSYHKKRGNNWLDVSDIPLPTADPNDQPESTMP